MKLKDPQGHTNLKISQKTYEKAEFAKHYLQKKYSNYFQNDQKQKQSWKRFNNEIMKLKLTSQEQKALKQQIMHQKMNLCRKKRFKVSSKDFQVIKIIGKGAFGQVRLCKQIKNGRLVAIKSLNKKQMIKKNQQAHVKTERNILTNKCEWIVKLFYSFQDESYLYLVMQFLPGGDLMTQLIRRNLIPEKEARFYVAELILAIQSMHKLGYIHRDLKPDNILIDKWGHIKLSDFGLCKKYDELSLATEEAPKSYRHNNYSGQKQNNDLKLNKTCLLNKNLLNRRFSAVGTPDYIAPEVLRRNGYDQNVDWWSLGVILYQMLYGITPFNSQNNQQIYFKIQNHAHYLYFLNDIQVSDAAVLFMHQLLVQPQERISINKIKSHIWLKDIQWDNLKNSLQPPFLPFQHLQSQNDTRFFDSINDQNKKDQVKNIQQLTTRIYKRNTNNKDFNFVGYSYKQEQTEPDIFQEMLQRAKRQKQINQQQLKIELLFSKNQQKLGMRKKKNKAHEENKKSKQKLNTDFSKVFSKGTTKKILKQIINRENQFCTDQSHLKQKSPVADRAMNYRMVQCSKGSKKWLKGQFDKMKTQRSTISIKKSCNRSLNGRNSQTKQNQARSCSGNKIKRII